MTFQGWLDWSLRKHLTIEKRQINASNGAMSESMRMSRMMLRPRLPKS
jgi:hypothetical protein